MHNPLRWAQAGVAAVKTHPVRYTLIGLVMYGVVGGRLQRWLLLTQLASIAVNLWSKPVPQSQSPAD